MGTLVTAFFINVLFYLVIGMAIGLPLARLGVGSWRNDSANVAVVGLVAFVTGFFFFRITYEPLVRWSVAATVREGQNVSITDYHAIGPRLPAEASNITYHTDIRRTDAIFSVPEAAFLKWAKDNQWKVSSIQSSEQVRLWEMNLETTVDQGFVAEQFDPSVSSIYAVFDRAKGVCYYAYASD